MKENSPDESCDETTEPSNLASFRWLPGHVEGRQKAAEQQEAVSINQGRPQNWTYWCVRNLFRKVDNKDR